MPTDAITMLTQGDMTAWKVSDERQRNAARRAILAQQEPAARESERLLGELNDLLLTTDPIALYAQLHVWDSMRRSATDAYAAFGSDAMLEFLGGLVTAMPADEIASRLGREFHPQLMFDADHLLREFARVQQQLFFARQLAQTDGSTLDTARFMLGLERRFDRMQGYTQHLERIYARVLSPLDDLGREHLGYPPAIVLKLADAHGKRIESRFRDVQDGINAHIAELDPPRSRGERLQSAAVLAAGLCRFGAPQPEEDLAGDLAAMTSLPRSEVSAAIDALSVKIGDQPPVTGLADDPLIRIFPVLQLPDGRRLWVRPIDLMQGLLDWCAAVCEDVPPLRDAFDKSRQRGCEELSAEALEAVFTTSRVHRNPTYNSPGRPDTDVLVTLPNACVVVEAKGRRFTAAGRAGLPKRVATKFTEFVDEPLAQSERAATSLRNDPGSWRDRSGRRLDLKTPTVVSRIVVTLERVDPFAMMISEIHQPNDDSPQRPLDVWMVALADLLAVTDVLETPHELFAYIDTRTRVTQRGYPTIMMETDALAAWCNDRLGHLELPHDVRWMLAYQSEKINEYFTSAALSESTTKPSSGVPGIVLAALDQILTRQPECWLAACTKVTATTRNEWKSVSKARAANATGGAARRTRQRANRINGGMTFREGFTLQILQGSLSAPSPIPPALVIRTTANASLSEATWHALDQ